MGVLCTERGCDKDSCGCQDVSTGSPRPASLPSSSPPTSPSAHQSRKRSLDLTSSQTEEADSKLAAVRRRIHRTPSAGSINGTTVHPISLVTTRASKLIATDEDIAAVVLGKNGTARHDAVTTRAVKGLKLTRVPPASCDHQKSDDKLRSLCLDHHKPDLQDERRQNGHCNLYSRTNQNSHIILPDPASTRHLSPLSQVKENSSPLLSSTSSLLSLSSLSPPSSSTPSVPHKASDESIKATNNNSSNSDNNTCSNVNGACTTITTNSITTFEGSSNILPSINGDLDVPTTTVTLPSPPSHESRVLSNSSPSLTCSKQQQQHHQLSNAQGLLPGIEGSSGRHNSSIPSFSSFNNAASVATTSSIARCSSASSALSDTVPNLRQRSYSGSNNSKTSVLSSSSSSSTEAVPSFPTSKVSPLSSLPKQNGLTKVKSSSSTSSISSNSSSSSSSSALPAVPQQVECKWRGCSLSLDPSDLLDHVRKHAEAQISKKKYACLWTDCKVYDQPSLSGSWLERHIVSHSGHRPFKCIVPKCGQRFHSQMTLERHVNGHFTTTSPGTTKTGRSREEINQQRMIQKRRKQLKRRSVQSVKTSDFFDEETMSMVKQQVQNLTQLTQLGLSDSNPLSVSFSGTVVGRRTNVSGSKQSLVEFKPSDIMEDHWMSESSLSEQDLTDMCIPLAFLPHDTVTHLHSSLYRRHRFRKHRRK